MRWLPSTKSRYLLLGASLLAVIALIDWLVVTASSYQGLGFPVAVGASFTVVYAWLLLEPAIDAAIVIGKTKERNVLQRVNYIGAKVAAECNLQKPKFIVYHGKNFDVMTVGIGRATTIFISEPAANMPEDELRAVLAHEYGHITLGHAFFRFVLFGSLLTLAMLINGVPLLAMVANLFVLWVMRQMEFAADKKAASFIGAASLEKALRSVGLQLGESPRWQVLFSTHPRFIDRIRKLDA